MSDHYLLINSTHHQNVEQIDCPDPIATFAAYAQQVEKERGALKDSAPTHRGDWHVFVGAYINRQQVSWTVRYLKLDGSWTESLMVRNGDGQEILESAGQY